MNKFDLADRLTVGIFADRDTLPEAMEYAYEAIKRLDNPALAMTALHVVLNTVAKEIKRLEEIKFMNPEEQFCGAYALGYYHGRVEGVEENPYADDKARHDYRLGYDAGVADYCREMHPEEEGV